MPNTRWSVVVSASSSDEEERRAALELLLSQYLPVLKHHAIVAWKLTPHQAEDLVQNFALNKLIEKEILSDAMPERGRLRSFVLKSFENFIRSDFRKQNAAKRKLDSKDRVNIDDIADLLGSPSEQEELFAVSWAREVLALSFERMSKMCTAKDEQAVWAIFNQRLVRPLLFGDNVPTYDELVTKLSLVSPTQAGNLMVTAKRMFKRIFRDVVCDTLADGEDVEEEIQDLKKALANAGSGAVLRSSD